MEKHRRGMRDCGLGCVNLLFETRLGRLDVDDELRMWCIDLLVSRGIARLAAAILLSACSGGTSRGSRAAAQM